VNEEHVVCANCYFHFSFLYLGRKDQPPDRPHEVLHAAVEKVVRSRMERYRKLEECFHPCPNCGFMQPWMVRIGRRMRVRTAVSITLGLLCLTYLVYVYLTAFAGAVDAGPGWWLALAGLVILGGAIAVYHAARIWDPNEAVDQESCGGAARVPESARGPNWDARPTFPVIPYRGKGRSWVGALIRFLGILAVVGGCCVFSLPLVSEGIAYHLERMNAVMLPFWSGIGLIALGSGTAAGVGIQRRLLTRRETRRPATPATPGRVAEKA